MALERRLDMHKTLQGMDQWSLSPDANQQFKFELQNATEYIFLNALQTEIINWTYIWLK